MRKLAGLLVVGVMLLSGCGADATEEKMEEDENVQYLFPYTVTLNDGTVVECVMTTTANGLWCKDSEGDY
jgi:hypothetical protein